MNIEKWEAELKDNPDKLLIQYIKFGFPLSLVAPDKLNNTQIYNHYLASQFLDEVERCLNTETECSAMLGPINQVNLRAFHCSPLLSRPKDGNKYRIILNLSHPYGASVKDHVIREAFDKNKFTLKFPTIDSIVNSIKALKHSDPVLYKIDVARPFHN